MTESAILIFSKSADRGLVKTRLRSILSEEQCLSLHLALLQDTITKCRNINMDTYLYLAGSGHLPFDPGIPVVLQAGADLGERLSNAFRDTLTRYRNVVTIGTDSPTFPISRIDETLKKLQLCDLVLGPSDDGGYYLIALKHFLPEIFSGIPWGTSQVLNATRNAARNHRTFLLPRCFDVDEPPDLGRLESELKDEPNLAHTREWFQKYHAM